MAHTYPRLKFKDIIITLEKYVPELKLRSTDYLEPNKEFWVRAYQLLLSRLLDASYDELFPPNLHMKYGMEEYYENSLVIKYVLKYMQRAMHICKFNDFNLIDIIFPDKSRLQDILSASCNYLTFRETREIIVKNIVDEREQNLGEIDSLRVKISDMLQMKVNIDSSVKESNMEQIIKEKMLVNKRLENEIEKASVNKMEHSKIASDIEKILCEKDNFKATIEELLKKSVELDNLICLSPEQMVQEIEELKTSNERLEAEIGHSPDELIELQRVGNVYSELFKLIPQINAHLDSLKNTDLKIKSFQDKLKLMEAGTVESYMNGLKAELENKRLIKKELLLNIKNYECNKKEIDYVRSTISETKKKLLKTDEEKMGLNETLGQLRADDELLEITKENKLNVLVEQQEEIIKLFEEKKEHVENAIKVLIKNLQ